MGKPGVFEHNMFFALLQSCVLLFRRCYSDAQVVLFRGRGIQYFQNAFNRVAEVKVASLHGYLWWGGLANATSGHVFLFENRRVSGLGAWAAIFQAMPLPPGIGVFLLTSH